MWSPKDRKPQNFVKTLVLLRYSSPCQNSITCYELLPAFLSNKLSEYDDTLQEMMCLGTNTLLTSDDPSWLQATLPVKFGSLGICSAVQVATSAYLSSVAASEDLVTAISIDTRCCPFNLLSPFLLVSKI